MHKNIFTTSRSGNTFSLWWKISWKFIDRSSLYNKNKPSQQSSKKILFMLSLRNLYNIKEQYFSQITYHRKVSKFLQTSYPAIAMSCIFYEVWKWTRKLLFKWNYSQETDQPQKKYMKKRKDTCTVSNNKIIKVIIFI